MRYISKLMFFCGAVTSLHAGWEPTQFLAHLPAFGPVGIANTPSSDVLITTMSVVTRTFGPSPYYVLIDVTTGGLIPVFPANPIFQTDQQFNNIVLPIFCSTLNKTLITLSERIGTQNVPTFTTYDGTSFTSAAPIYPSPTHQQGADPHGPIWPSFDSHTSTALVVWLDTTFFPHYPVYSTSTDLVNWSPPLFIPGVTSIDTTYTPYVTATSDDNGSFFICMTSNEQTAYYAIIAPGTNTVDATAIPNSNGHVSAWANPTYQPTTQSYIITWVDFSSDHFPTYTIFNNGSWTTPTNFSTVSAQPIDPIVSAVDNISGHILFAWENTNGFLYSAEYDQFQNTVLVQSQPSSEPPFVISTGNRKWALTSVQPSTGNPYITPGTGPFFTSTTTTVNTAPNPSKFTETVTIKAVVSPSNATGRVIFRVNGKKIGSAPLINGVARFTTCTLPRGRDTITATYLGNDQFSGSSGSKIQIVH